jgi:hypothetical protein
MRGSRKKAKGKEEKEEIITDVFSRRTLQASGCISLALSVGPTAKGLSLLNPFYKIILFMKAGLLIFIILFSLIGAQNSFAQTIIKAELDKTSITADDDTTYKLIITSSENKLPEPQIAAFEGFGVVSQAQSSTVSFVKGSAKTILVYAFILAPKDLGKFKIGPSTIKVKDKTYSSESFEIEVKAGKSPHKPKSKGKLSSPEEEILPEQQPQQPIPEESAPESDQPKYNL